MSALDKKGFTLVELSLSIAFIAILSIIIVIMITNTISSYRRGMTLNKINSTGMDLVDEIRATVQNSPSRSLTELCDNDKYISRSYSNKCKNNGGKLFASVVFNDANSGVPAYGVFCTGSYSYIWNSGYYFSAENNNIGLSPVYLKYSDGEDVKKIGDGDKFKLLKVEDKERAVCTSMIAKEYTLKTASNEIDISGVPGGTSEPVEILSGDVENDLAIYYLDSATPAESKSSRNLFYAVSFVLGTIQGGINVNASGNFCATLEGERSELENLDFCAINKFNFAVQATGE